MAMPMDCGTATVKARMLLQLAINVRTRHSLYGRNPARHRFRNFHPEGAKFEQASNHRVGIFASRSISSGSTSCRRNVSTCLQRPCRPVPPVAQGAAAARNSIGRQKSAKTCPGQSLARFLDPFESFDEGAHE